MTERGDAQGAQELVRTLGALHDKLIVVMQAAWIEWRHGGGAEIAMQWIENTLDGPDLIPDENEPYSTDAQRFFDLNQPNPNPACAVCGIPSHTLWMGKGFCSDEHLTEYRARV